MAIEISEKMQIESPLDEAWAFILDPTRVVTCMPGAELVEQVDDKTYLGKIRVKLGAITTDYQGQVVFASVDESSRTIQITGEGRETSGGTAKGQLEIRVLTLDEGGTEMRFDARAEVTGRVMQMGGRMIKGVSAQIFKQFAANARQQLDVAREAADAGVPAPAPPEQEALAVGTIVVRTIWQAIVDFFRKLFAWLFRRGSR